MKKLLLLGACLWALSVNPVLAQAADPDIVVVRVNEYIGSVDMVISHGPGKSEFLKFENGTNQKRLTSSAEEYYKVFSKLYQQGYTLQSTFTAALASANSSNTTLLFVKAPKP